MQFKKFFAVIIGVILIGVSIGYVLGFYVSFFFKKEFLFYLAVPIMALGSFITIYVTIDNK